MGLKDLIERIKNWFLGRESKGSLPMPREKEQIDQGTQSAKNNNTDFKEEIRREAIKGEEYDFITEYDKINSELAKLSKDIDQLVSKYRMIANGEMEIDKIGIEKMKRGYKEVKDRNYMTDYFKTENNVNKDNLNTLLAFALHGDEDNEELKTEIIENYKEERYEKFREYFLKKNMEIKRREDRGDRYTSLPEELREIKKLYRKLEEMQTLFGKLTGMRKAALDYYAYMSDEYLDKGHEIGETMANIETVYRNQSKEKDDYYEVMHNLNGRKIKAFEESLQKYSGLFKNGIIKIPEEDKEEILEEVLEEIEGPHETGLVMDPEDFEKLLEKYKGKARNNREAIGHENFDAIGYTEHRAIEYRGNRAIEYNGNEDNSGDGHDGH